MNPTILPKSRTLFAAGAIVACAGPAAAQKAPEVGYVYPPGARAGSTVEVHLGGYDWTPDLQYFVHHPGVKLEITGPLSPVFVTPPPYWSGPKTYSEAPLLPRERPARLTLPADLPPGPVRWQVASANGGSTAGVFWVGTNPEILEEPHRREPQKLPALPLTVNGRVSRIAEVDRYRFSVPEAGPVTCDLFARRVGADFNGVLEVRDSRGRLVADAVDTEGRDTALTFAAKAGEEYVVGVHDVDFNGDRAFVYRLELTPGPRVLAAYPAGGQRGERARVEFVGIGVATGAAKLESVSREVTFPASGDELSYLLQTAHGVSPAFPLLVSAGPETVEGADRRLPVPSAVTGTLAQPGEADRYTCELKQGQRVSLEVQARRFGSPLDVSLAVLGPDGKELARGDDAPETTDAALEFAVPADGVYTLVVSEVGREGGSRTAAYRLAVAPALPGFHLEAAARVNVLLGGKAELLVKARRHGGFAGPIALQIRGLPEGITAPADLAIPRGQSEVKVALQASATAPATAALAVVTGTATLGDQAVTRTATGMAGGDRAPRAPEENALPVVLVSGIMKPRWTVSPADKDGGRTVHRGTTYPAEVLIERMDGFDGPLELQMSAEQARHRMGSWGPDLPVPAGVRKTYYPCFMPEWLETSRTSRMNLLAVGKVADPRGNVRYLAAPADGRITMSIEGALLKITHEASELNLKPGDAVEVPVRVARSAKLPLPVRLEIQAPLGMEKLFTAEAMELSADRGEGRIRIVAARSPALRGTIALIIRAVAMQEGKLPVVSQTTIELNF